MSSLHSSPPSTGFSWRTAFPILSVDVDVAVDVNERGNRARQRPKSRTCATKLKACLGLRSSMRISAPSSSLRLPRV